METKNLFETFANAQKQAVENMTSATENMQKMFNNDTMSSEFFKKWYDSQMAFFNQSNGEATKNPMEFYNTWMNNQTEMAKNWMGNMPNYTNFNGMDSMKSTTDNMMALYQNWVNTMNTSYSEMTKNFENMDAKNMMGGMFNNSDMYMNVFKLWMPMFKSLNDKTFDMETFKAQFNAPLFKDIMDKMFNMQPDFMKNMMNMPGMANVTENMNKMMDQNKAMFDNMKSTFGNMMPNGNNMFSGMMDNYNSMYGNMNNAFAPMMKLMGNDSNKKQFETMNELSSEFNNYQMRNAEMQYQMYQTGLKAMEELAENVYAKVRNGNDLKDFTNIYAEWLNISDKHFVALFSTEEYSKMQSELNSFGMKLKMNINGQMEKAMTNVPVVTRSEMDEAYKTIYEMKKRITMLEKQLDTDTEVEAKPAKKAAKKAAKNA
jgi:BMFP domain-containing protein YqiC